MNMDTTEEDGRIGSLVATFKRPFDILRSRIFGQNSITLTNDKSENVSTSGTKHSYTMFSSVNSNDRAGRQPKRLRMLKKDNFALDGYIIKISQLPVCIEMAATLWLWSQEAHGKWHKNIPAKFDCIADIKPVMNEQTNYRMHITINPNERVIDETAKLCLDKLQEFLKSLPSMFKLYSESVPEIYFVVNLPNIFQDDTFLCEDNESVLVVGTNRDHVVATVQNLRDTFTRDIGQGEAPPRKREQASGIEASYEKSGIRIHVLEGDITKLRVQAVVNAANGQLQHGGGIAAAISKAAGPDLQRTCNKHIRDNGVMSTSQVYTTGGFNMPCQSIIHVVGPRWRDYKSEREARGILMESFTRVLAEAKRQKFTSIAIPAVSSGIYGAPSQIVADIMFGAVHTFVKTAECVKDILLVDINIQLLNRLITIFDDAVCRRELQCTATGLKRFQNDPFKTKYDQPTHEENPCEAMKGSTQIKRKPGARHRVLSQGKGLVPCWTIETKQMKTKDSLSFDWTRNSREISRDNMIDTRISNSVNPSLKDHINDYCEPAYGSNAGNMSMVAAGATLHSPDETPEPFREVPGATSDTHGLKRQRVRSQSQITGNSSTIPSNKTRRRVLVGDKCAICLDKPENKTELPLCKHVFCKECIDNWFQTKPTCPNCGLLYGELRGDQPDNGTMDVQHGFYCLPGFENGIGTIEIKYDFPGGRQKECHPNPGKPYRGITRVAFLPDNDEGRRVLALLRRAFDARLIFTIGRSTTTGQDGVITWNDIHHKTNRDGGPDKFGYPDPTYLSRVSEELAAKGIK